jgi:DNA polymerase III subunit delta'
VQSLASVVGHRRLTTLLSQTISRVTLPPTLLFIGLPGVGKYRVARSVAAVLNCLSPVIGASGVVLDACGACRSCDRIARDVHVDVLTLMPDERASIKIDVVRDVLERTGFRPFEGRRRVVVIREADALEVAAQNALLKSLEEPPAGTIFILTTSVPAALLPTVASRCMRLRFGRLTERDVETILMRDHGMSAKDAREAATLADGSVGQALAMGSTDLAVLRETAMLLLRQTAASRALAARLQAASVVSTTPARKERTREDVGMVLRFVRSMLRDIELLNASGDARALANPGAADELQGLTRAFAGDRARNAFAAVDRAIDALERNAGTKVVSEWVAVQI